ncbi:MAG: methylated-DNA--[protein]-cysteine S-methyltransferase [Solirubrobacteraceae bacterium]
MSRATRGLPPQERRYTSIDSPLGTLTLVATAGVLSGLFMVDQRHRPPAEAFGAPDATPFSEVIEQLGEYFVGRRTAFELQLAAVGTPFQLAVWEALRHIPYGERASYGQIAQRIGRPGASRAVGLANGANPIGIIVPCHRVVGSDGSLTGYGGGLERKRLLLELESVRSSSAWRSPSRSSTT